MTARTSDDLWEVMSTARAVRRYRDEPVDRAVIDRCLEAATWAPSGGNQQPWRFVELRAPELRAIIGEAARADWQIMTEFYGFAEPDPDDPDPRARTLRVMRDYMLGAATVPVCFLFCVRPQRGASPLEQGGSIFPAVQNFLLAARAQGLGASVALWHRSKEDELRPLVGIPDDWLVACTVTAGWPVGRHGPLRRKPVAEVACVDRWAAG
jgi:nitroreductase